MGNKLTTYLLILSVVLLLFHFAGLIANTPISFLLNLLVNPQNVQASTFYTVIYAAIAGFAITGIVIGTFSRARTDLIAKAPIAILLVAFAWDLVAVFGVVRQVNAALAALVLSPLIIVFILAVVEWWGGHD